MDPRPADLVAALRRDRMLPKAFRDAVSVLSLPHVGGSPASLAQAVGDLRRAAGHFAPQAALLAPALAAYEAAARGAGIDVGDTAASADAAALGHLWGAWVVEGPLPEGGEVVTGGFMTPAYYGPLVAPADAPPPSDRGGFFTLGALWGPASATPWSVYLDALESDALRERVRRIRRALDATRGVVGRASGAWTNDHHFAFPAGPPLGFSWRAWGDLVVALRGEGHYMDWY